jgi:hypothetical protein
MFASCATITSNPNLHNSSFETEVNIGKEELEKSTYLIELNFPKPLAVSISRRSEEWNSAPGLEFDNSKPQLKTGIFKRIS